MVISMLKIRRPLGRLIFNMGIAIPGKTVFLIETAPSYLDHPDMAQRVEQLSVVNVIPLYPGIPLKITEKIYLGGLRMLYGWVLVSSSATDIIRAPDSMMDVLKQWQSTRSLLIIDYSYYGLSLYRLYRSISDIAVSNCIRVKHIDVNGQ